MLGVAHNVRWYIGNAWCSSECEVVYRIPLRGIYCVASKANPLRGIYSVASKAILLRGIS